MSNHTVCLWMAIYIYIYIYIYIVPPARISLTPSRHFSLSFIAFGRSSGLHPVSSHSCCMYIRAGRASFARPYVGVHRSTSLMSSTLLLIYIYACVSIHKWLYIIKNYSNNKNNIYGVVVNKLDCDILLCEFKLYLRYYAHLRTNSVRKCMISLIPPALW